MDSRQPIGNMLISVYYCSIVDAGGSGQQISVSDTMARGRRRCCQNGVDDYDGTTMVLWGERMESKICLSICVSFSLRLCWFRRVAVSGMASGQAMQHRRLRSVCIGDDKTA